MPTEYQPLQLPESELKLIQSLVEADFQTATQYNQYRVQRQLETYLRFMQVAEAQAPEDVGKSSFRSPLLLIHVLAKLAQVVHGLFGQGATTKAEPTGDSDDKTAEKAGKFLHFFLMTVMRFPRICPMWLFHTIVFGRGLLLRTPKLKLDDEKQPAFETIDLQPLWPYEIVTPNEDVNSIQDFSFVGRKTRVTPQNLIDGERDGRYSGVEENWEKICQHAQSKTNSATDTNKNQFEQFREKIEELWQMSASGRGNDLQIYEWYGRHRLPLVTQAEDGTETIPEVGLHEWDKRERDETELLVLYLPHLKLIVGVHDLKDLYPNAVAGRRPFSELRLLPFGGYWSIGLGDLLGDLDAHEGKNQQTFQDAARGMAAAVTFYEPAAGFDPQLLKIGPGASIPVDNVDKIKMVFVGGNLEPLMVNSQTFRGMAELLTGTSDASIGRSSDRPNAPRTLGGQQLLFEMATVRQFLEQSSIVEGLKDFLRDVWHNVRDFATDQLFFRITEKSGKGVTKGHMTLDELRMDYDFTFEFAASLGERQQKRENAIARYQASISNPLVMQDPVALWRVTSDLFEALGANFGEIVPEPPAAELAKTPEREWALMLQGEMVRVHPADDDERHIAQHTEQMTAAIEDPKRDDPEARQLLETHIEGHILQRQQKQTYQAILQQQAGTMLMNSGMETAGNGLAGLPAFGAPVAAGKSAASKKPKAGGGDAAQA